MAQSKGQFDHVVFSQDQLAYLESVFPSLILGPNSSEGHMRYFFGQMSVIDVIRSKTRGNTARLAQPHPSNIPAPG